MMSEGTSGIYRLMADLEDMGPERLRWIKLLRQLISEYRGRIDALDDVLQKGKVFKEMEDRASLGGSLSDAFHRE